MTGLQQRTHAILRQWELDAHAHAFGDERREHLARLKLARAIVDDQLFDDPTGALEHLQAEIGSPFRLAAASREYMLATGALLLAILEARATETAGDALPSTREQESSE